MRTERWRYILYNNGNEELYDHEQDPYEWINLAGHTEPADRLKAMRQRIAQAIGVPGLAER